MDVDSKPQNQPPTPPEGTESQAAPIESFEPAQEVSEFEPVQDNSGPMNGSPSPLIAEALEGESMETLEETEPQTVPSVMDAPAPAVEKKSRKPLIIIVIIAALLIIVGLFLYVFYGMPKNSTTASDTTKTSDKTTIQPVSTETSAQTVDSVANAITSNASNEATTASTDDSTQATDASMKAANVGDSINENNF